MAERSNEQWCSDLADMGATGDAARRALRERMVGALRRLLSGRGLSPDLAEDLAQEALLRVSERLGSFRGDSRFTTWALAIATRLAFDELRHHRFRDVSLDAIAEDARGGLTVEPAPQLLQERLLVRERVLSELRAVIDGELTDKQRTVLLAELRGVPQSEIAMQLGMTRNALYKLAHDARQRLKQRLTLGGIAAGEVLWAFQ